MCIKLKLMVQKKKLLGLLLFVSLNTIAVGQAEQLTFFKPFMNKTWVADSNWTTGSAFRQEARFTFGLDSTIVIVQSNGFTNPEQTQFGPRNLGIRQYDHKEKKFKFWEFDVSGGLTIGEVVPDGKDLFYHYSYGELFLTDAWLYQNDSTYQFKVGSYKDGEWEKIYLEAQFRARDSFLPPKLPNYQSYLSGNWSSKAWDGILNESWEMGIDGHLHQSAQYLENGQVLYEANNKIEMVKGELILFTVIKDANPKIFKASSWDEKSITFENSDYSNPNVVIYKFITPTAFNRTIKGVENGQPTSYTFKFKKIKD